MPRSRRRWLPAAALLSAALGSGALRTPAVDCNGNEVDDLVEVRDGTAPDCNGNGVPDACDVPGGAYSLEPLVPFPGDAFSPLRTADLDGDGLHDLLSVRRGGVRAFWSRGDGTFEAVEHAVFDDPSDVASGDVDGDGDLDLIVSTRLGDSILVLEQESPRSFRLRGGTPAPMFTWPTFVACADFEGDGDVDVAALGEAGGTLLVSRNDGDGDFESPMDLPVRLVPPAVHVADLDGDGAFDVAGNDGGLGLLVHWNEGGRLSGANPMDATISPRNVAAADIDGDGDRDLAAGSFPAILIAIQGPGRAFRVSERPFDPVRISGVAWLDLEGDGLQDLVAGTGEDGFGANILLLRNRGDGDLAGPVSVRFPGVFNVPRLVGADFDGDGRPDLAAAGVFFDAPLPYAFQIATKVAVFINHTVRPGSLDRNQNGRPDECDPGAFRRGDSDGDGAVSLGDAVFTLRSLFQGGPAPGCAESADADNDGALGISDAVSVLEFLFRGGPPPAPPGPPPGPCGLDTDAPGSPANLGCDSYSC